MSADCYKDGEFGSDHLKGLVDKKRAALELCIQRASLPLIGELDGNGHVTPIYPRGPGLLFYVEDRLFLVTAEHVLNDIDFSRLSFHQNSGSQVQSFWTVNIFRKIGGYPEATAQTSALGLHQKLLIHSTVELSYTPQVSNPSLGFDAFYLLMEN